MLHNTKGIVLRTIKYGDTSIVVTIYTELFGVQSYLVNGVRTEKKSTTKANIYQPTTLLDIVVYHTPNKNLQRIKEARVHYFFQTLQSNIVKNTIAIYITELINKTITDPESNSELYYFFEEAFLFIDQHPDHELADFPIVFTLQLAQHVGFGIQGLYSTETPMLDLQNGQFCSLQDMRSLQFIDGEMAMLVSHFNMMESNEYHLNHVKRKEILAVCIQYLRLHIPHMSELKSVDILHEILS